MSLPTAAILIVLEGHFSRILPLFRNLRGFPFSLARIQHPWQSVGTPIAASPRSALPLVSGARPPRSPAVQPPVPSARFPPLNKQSPLLACYHFCLAESLKAWRELSLLYKTRQSPWAWSSFRPWIFPFLLEKEVTGNRSIQLPPALQVFLWMAELGCLEGERLKVTLSLSSWVRDIYQI